MSKHPPADYHIPSLMRTDCQPSKESQRFFAQCNRKYLIDKIDWPFI
jgi:hypothetical protein